MPEYVELKDLIADKDAEIDENKKEIAELTQRLEKMSVVIEWHICEIFVWHKCLLAVDILEKNYQ